MVGKKMKRMVLYAVAILAVGFGIEWGFAYILETHSAKRAHKRQAADPRDVVSGLDAGTRREKRR